MSPTVFITGNLKIKIHKRDHNPPHIHIEGPGGITAVLDLETAELMHDTDLSPRDLARVQDYIKANKLKLLEIWDEFRK